MGASEVLNIGETVAGGNSSSTGTKLYAGGTQRSGNRCPWKLVGCIEGTQGYARHLNQHGYDQLKHKIVCRPVGWTQDLRRYTKCAHMGDSDVDNSRIHKRPRETRKPNRHVGHVHIDAEHCKWL